jgi:hypothetical protein
LTVFGYWGRYINWPPQFVSPFCDNQYMRSNPSKVFPFEKPIYWDWLFYIFLLFSIQGMKQNLIDFYNYGDPSRLIPLLFDFISSVLSAWILVIPIYLIRDYFNSKYKARRQAKLNKLAENGPKSINPDLRITKFDKSIGEMNESERKIAVDKLSEVMINQIDKYKKDK